MKSLVIQDVGDSESPQFNVVRQRDGKQAGPFVIPSPIGYPIEGRQDDLMTELTWYLERFLSYPFSPRTERAARIQEALKNWGTEAFHALFDDVSSRRLFDEATRDGSEELDLQVSSDNPAILHWPWEALRDPEMGVLSRTGRFERRLNQQRDPHPLSDALPRDRVNILLVTARPYDRDVQYRSISRPLVEQIERLQLPARVRVLRPPTFDRLRAHLRERPNYYHILHFDGHGAYGSAPESIDSHLLRSPLQGQLVFEDGSGKPDEKSAEILSEFLREHRIPMVVLNACQSAMVDDGAQDPFASVAAGLLRSGVRSVVAMAYSLYVSGAQEFLPAFYERLFESRTASEAVRAGRQQMVAQPNRVCARGRFPLEDWLVPVLYQQDPYELEFEQATPTAEHNESRPLPPEALDAKNPYGLVGRDMAILEIERAMRRKPGGILIHGLGGVGKTTLARGLVQWLHSTEGLEQGCIWISFQDVRSAEYVLNRMLESLNAHHERALPIAEKVQFLIRALNNSSLLVVWDNFEVVNGGGAYDQEVTFSDEDRERLIQILEGTRGGKSKILITSRAPESWLSKEVCFKLPLGGLIGEERWEFCEQLLDDLGMKDKVDRKNPDWKKLIDLLDGHPLAMRVILPKLEEQTPAQLIEKLERDLSVIEGDNEESIKLFATLRIAIDRIPMQMRPLLIPIAYHVRFLDADYLRAIVEQVDSDLESSVGKITETLQLSGILRAMGKEVFEMHPVLSRFLGMEVIPLIPSEVVEEWTRAFVDVFGSLAQSATPADHHVQKGFLDRTRGTLFSALGQAERLGMIADIQCITQLFGWFALRNGDLQTAMQMYQMIEKLEEDENGGEASASTYHQLGRISEEQGDYSAARSWYEKSREIEERLGDERGAASTYHQLGIIAQKQVDYSAATSWYEKSLEIKERLGNERDAASTYHQLGKIAEEQGDYAHATSWYEKSLEIKVRLGNERNAAITYHQLGCIAEAQGDYSAATSWYEKSLEINERLGNKRDAASTYYELGMIAQEQGDYAQATSWYEKSLEINERLGNERNAASTYGQLSILALLKGEFEESANWSLKASVIFERFNDLRMFQLASNFFAVAYSKADSDAKARLKSAWDTAGLGDLPELSE